MRVLYLLGIRCGTQKHWRQEGTGLQQDARPRAMAASGEYGFKPGHFVGTRLLRTLSVPIAILSSAFYACAHYKSSLRNCTEINSVRHEPFDGHV